MFKFLNKPTPQDMLEKELDNLQHQHLELTGYVAFQIKRLEYVEERIRELKEAQKAGTYSNTEGKAV